MSTAMPRLTGPFSIANGLPSRCSKLRAITGHCRAACTIAQAIRWVKETFSPRSFSCVLSALRFASSVSTATVRNEVAVGTSFRTVAVDTLDAKRKALNTQLKERGLKVSFTHLIAWAIVQAARQWPVMARSFEQREGKPFAIENGPVNLGIAVDIERKDGSRSLMVPTIKGADGLDFAAFHACYENLIVKTRESKLTADDFQGTNISLTNPGGIGTVASVPRLMTGQGTIIATGSIAYPVEWAHATADKLKALGVSRVM